jgi:hypothetical protein
MGDRADRVKALARGCGAAALGACALAGAAAAQESRVPPSEAFAELARSIWDAEPPITHLHLLPFRSVVGGPGDCDTELSGAVADALAKRQADTLSSRRVDLVQGLGDGAGQEGHAVVRGVYGIASGQIWTEATVVGPTGVIAAALPRRALAGLICKGEAVSLISAVEQRTAGRADTGLTLNLREEARIGDAATFDLRSGLTEIALPLCLNVSADNTAQVVTPLRPGSPALAARGALSWPVDFSGSGITGGPFCHDREQNDAIVCFAVRNAANPELDRLWRSAWPAGEREPRELTADQTLALVAAASDTSAAAAARRYRVGPRPPGAPSACGRRQP